MATKTTFSNATEKAIGDMNYSVLKNCVTDVSFKAFMRDVKKVYFHAYETSEEAIRPVIMEALQNCKINVESYMILQAKVYNIEVGGILNVLKEAIDRLGKATTPQQYVEELSKIPSSESTQVVCVNSSAAFIAYFKAIDSQKAANTFAEEKEQLKSENEKLKIDNEKQKQELADLQKQMEGMRASIASLLKC